MPHFSAQLQRHAEDKNDELCATIFANLSEVLRDILDLQSTNLFAKIKEIVLFWHKLLKEKFAKLVIIISIFV